MKQGKLEYYKGNKPVNWIKGNRWRWRLTGANGEIICASSEGFFSKWNAQRNAKLTRDKLNILL